MPKKTRKLIPEIGDLNLAPIMNLMVTLIPMLLLSAAFLELVVLETSLPVYNQSAQEQEQKIEKPKLGLTVVIKDEGFSIGGQGGMLKLEDGSSTISKLSDGTYDFLSLSRALFSIKEKYPDEWSVIIVPEYTTSFDVIISTMDSTREYTLFSETGQALHKTMFPNVILGGGVI